MYLCPGEKLLKRKARIKKDKAIIYLASAKDCGGCALKHRSTASTARRVSRHMFEDALTRMNERATATAMRLRRSVVEHRFATIKYRIFGHPRLLLRGREGAHTELTLAVMAYNLKRMANVLGNTRLTRALQKS
jgi:transposase